VRNNCSARPPLDSAAPGAQLFIHLCVIIALHGLRWIRLLFQGAQHPAAVTTATAHSANLFGIKRLHHQTGFFIINDDLFGFFFGDIFGDIAAQTVFNIIFSVGTKRKTVVMGFVAIMASQFSGFSADARGD
jgi:hypothetical protein